MPDLQDEGIVTVYSDVYLRYRVMEILLFTVMGVCEVQGEGNVTV